MLLSKLYSIAFLQPGRADLNLESGTCLSSALKCGGGGGCLHPTAFSSHPSSAPISLASKSVTSSPQKQSPFGPKSVHFIPQLPTNQRQQGHLFFSPKKSYVESF